MVNFSESPDPFRELYLSTPGLGEPYPVVYPAEALKVAGAQLPGAVRRGEIGLTYLDGAATTRPLGPVLEARARLIKYLGNTHGMHSAPARISSYYYDQAHRDVLRYASAPQGHMAVMVGQGTTDAINLAAHMLFGPGAKGDPRKEWAIFTGDNHHANIVPWQLLVPNKKFLGIPVSDRERGVPDYDAVYRALKERKGRVKVVAVSGMSNVTGIIPDIGRFAEMARQFGAQLLVDDAHGMPHARRATVPGIGFMGMESQGIDMLAFSAHKFYTGEPPGVLIMPEELAPQFPVRLGGGIVKFVSLEETVFIGGSYEREEAGTPPILGTVALSEAIRVMLEVGPQRAWDHEQALVRQAIVGLLEIPQVRVYGDTDLDRTPRGGVFTFNIEGLPHPIASAALMNLYAIATRNGCFCAHPLMMALLNLSPAEVESYRRAVLADDHSNDPGSVRGSIGIYTLKEQIEIFLRAVKELVARRDKIVGDYTVGTDGRAVRKDGWQIDPAQYEVVRPVSESLWQRGVPASTGRFTRGVGTVAPTGDPSGQAPSCFHPRQSPAEVRRIMGDAIVFTDDDAVELAPVLEEDPDAIETPVAETHSERKVLPFSLRFASSATVVRQAGPGKLIHATFGPGVR